ncbi:MAG: phosphatidate cytidylyltransferase [Alphaproteobacteria bacterium]|nr:phosphatidate cytidylyltransferase [Alphaproteobacteria bacterium]
MTTLQKRILSAIVLAPIVVAAVWYGGVVFYGLMAAVFAISMYEWRGLSRIDGRMQYGLLLVGAVYMGVACLAAVWLRDHVQSGLYLLLYVMFAIWACDSGAYAAGKTFGGPKMAPKISPNKTWAGLIGGCLASAIVVTGLTAFCKDGPLGVIVPVSHTYFVHFIIGLVLAVIGQIGDLLISILKRRAGLKDTGNIIPGHGGLLDRIDALLLALIVFASIIYILEHMQ